MTPRTAPAPSIVDLLSRAPRTDSLTFCRRPDDATQLNELRTVLADAKRVAARKGARPADRTAVRKAEEAVSAFLKDVPTITFNLAAIGAQAAEDLIREHPADDEQIAQHEEVRKLENEQLIATGSRERVPALQWNPITFPPALIAASVETIVVTGENGRTIDGAEVTPEVIAKVINGPSWSITDQQTLIMVCNTLNQASSGITRDLVDRLGEG